MMKRCPDIFGELPEVLPSTDSETKRNDSEN